MATAILIDATKRSITLVTGEDRPDFPIWTNISLQSGSRNGIVFDDFVSAANRPIEWTVIASDCGFVLRYERKRFVIPGSVYIERLEKKEGSASDWKPADTGFTLDDFVISDKDVPGKYAIQWI